MNIEAIKEIKNLNDFNLEDNVKTIKTTAGEFFCLAC